MKVLSAYRFKNGKTIEVRYLSPSDQKRRGVPECDTLELAFVHDGEGTGYFIRPDEAVIIINLLSDALFKSVDAYDVKLHKGYSGFDR